MLGAILGDIAGSDLEWSKPSGYNYKTSPLFMDQKRFTDDTVLTIATKYAIRNNISFASAYKSFGLRYYDKPYGKMFKAWLDTDGYPINNSYGNGSAMRVSYIGDYFNDIVTVGKYAAESARCTHCSKEGVKGAMAIAVAGYLARVCKNKKRIQRVLTQSFGYNLDIPLDEIRPTYIPDATCQNTVPLAIRCFLESESYEDCLRKVFSFDGDLDTIAAMSGGIAENFYGMMGLPTSMLIYKYLDTYLISCLIG